MKKGDLNRRIRILRSTPTDDGTATVPGPPIEIGRRWAKRVDVSDGERLRAAETGQSLTTRFTVISDSLTRTIDGKDSLRLGNESFQVLSTKSITSFRREGIEITCSSRPDSTP
ncbi:phage head-tail adaptor, putative [Sphingomonas sp. LH128]|uniref:phage head completion protein n=1 Tax=Sphingomonas sp. LH128 TaxID=473781 RepID=UPI00027CA6DC|nr:head-tail adaptor protein [Sphingomonas sp. LH128]EJU13993.1 phage head-tail adaptor, putative [Sphingomonas sp. LH128]